MRPDYGSSELRVTKEAALEQVQAVMVCPSRVSVPK
jgi:hypothetical protein